MNEIVTDIFTWAWFSEPHGYNFNGHLVRHPEGNLCIDPVPPGDADLAEILRMGVTSICSPIATIRGRPTRCARAPARRPSSIRTTQRMPESGAELMGISPWARRAAR